MKAIKASAKASSERNLPAQAAAAPRQPAKTSAAKAKKPARAKTAAAKSDDLPVPPILLEGDQSPPAPAPSGPCQRYALGPVPPAHADLKDAGELPEAYGTKKLLLTARDPHWLYARWDFTREQQRKFNAASVDRHLVLRVFINEPEGEPSAQIHVHPESTHWFVHVGGASTKYVAEIGYYSAHGKWNRISTSGATLTPPDTMSDDTSAQFTSIPLEIPFSQLIEFARSAVQENVPIAEIFHQLRSSGYNFPEPAPGEKWTPERQRALSAIIKMDTVRRIWMGSVEITELVSRQLHQELSSIGAAQFSVPGSLPAGISSISSLSSPFGVAAEKRKNFWFMVNAELIIYGATEPDAEVTIGGRVIKLRADGSFSYRFALPDGVYDLPAVAVSADKTDGRAAELKFSRSTEYHGEVGTHPQDPQLKPPLVAHVA